MEATRVKHYPRQPHTQITVTANGVMGAYPGRTTEVTLWATLGGHYLEVNQFADETAVEPKHHELVFFPTGVSIESVEDKAPEGKAPGEGEALLALLPKDNGEAVQDAAPKGDEADGATVH